MIFLCSMVSELRLVFVRQCEVHVHTGVVRPTGVNMGNRRLIGAEMKGC